MGGIDGGGGGGKENGSGGKIRDVKWDRAGGRQMGQEEEVRQREP